LKRYQLLFPLLLFILLLATACSNSSSLQEAEEFPPTIVGVIEVDGVEYEMKSGGYRWQRRVGLNTQTVQTDHASPYQMAEHIEPITTSKGQKKARIKIPNNPELTVYLWNEAGREKTLTVDDHQITLPSVTGKYIYEVFTEWPNGEISYVFVIEVE
jgi:hypothetical protein